MLNKSPFYPKIVFQRYITAHCSHKTLLWQDATRLMDLEFTPAVDSWSKEPFLPKAPFYLMQQGLGSSVPFMMGTNRDEGVLDLFCKIFRYISCLLL